MQGKRIFECATKDDFRSFGGRSVSPFFTIVHTYSHFILKTLKPVIVAADYDVLQQFGENVKAYLTAKMKSEENTDQLLESLMSKLESFKQVVRTNTTSKSAKAQDESK